MKKKSVHFSSKYSSWETPLELFLEWDKKYQFTLDVCATSKNSKCPIFLDPEINGLTSHWEGNRCWMNPPYGREIKHWVKKAYMETRKPNTLVVGLLPARTDTEWFHEYVLDKARIEFVKKRISFLVDGAVKYPAPFPSLFAIWGDYR